MPDADRSLDDLMPADPVMKMAWIGGLRYAIEQDDMLAAFRHDTGNAWTPGPTALARMIDEACGADFAFFREFARWYNANVWGEDEQGQPIDAGA